MEEQMPARPSDLIMDLLQELASIKEQDLQYENGAKSDSDVADFEERRNRRKEIRDQIKALGESVA
jgi:hypothetical protein